MALLSLAPSSSLAVNDGGGALKLRDGLGEGERFILYSEGWLRIGYLFCAYHDHGLPLIPELRDLMNGLKYLADLFGDSRRLSEEIRHDPVFFERSLPPPQIFSHVIWFSGQNALAAESFSHTFASLAGRLSDTAVPDAARRAALLVEILTGQGGIQSLSKSMSDKSRALLKNILSFDREVEKQRDWLNSLRAANERAIRAHEKKLKDLERRLVELRGGKGGGAWRKREWDDMVRLHDKLVFTFKEALVSQDILECFRPDVTQLCQGMEEVEGVWLNVDMTISRIVSDYGPEQLGDLNWVMQSMNILEAQKRWADIGRLARRFTEAAWVPLPGKDGFQDFWALAAAYFRAKEHSDEYRLVDNS